MAHTRVHVSTRIYAHGRRSRAAARGAAAVHPSVRLRERGATPLRPRDRRLVFSNNQRTHLC